MTLCFSTLRKASATAAQIAKIFNELEGMAQEIYHLYQQENDSESLGKIKDSFNYPFVSVYIGLNLF